MSPWQQEEGDMAGSGITPQGIGGWSSGAGVYDRARQRRDDFLEAHPSWTIEHNRETDAYDAVEKTANGERLITEKSLGPLMDRLEAVYDTAEGA
jgi:hypothetical protein